MHPILFDLGTVDLFGYEIPLRLPSYGTAMLVGVVLGWVIVRWLGRRVLPEAPWADLYLGMIVAGLVGAKVLYALLEMPRLLAGEASWIAVLAAGGVWLGAVFGGALYCVWFLRRHEMPAGRTMNVIFTGLPLCHAIGRVGCFLAGCCYGAYCSMPWAVTYSSELAARYAGTPLGVPLHPTPLYEAGLELGNFAVCLAWWRRGEPPPWAVVFTWVGLYGVERFVLEFFRGDPRGTLWGLSTSQWLTAAMAMAALVFWVRRARLRRSAAA